MKMPRCSPSSSIRKPAAALWIPNFSLTNLSNGWRRCDNARNPDIKKVLVIGSGPIVIGQAAEFDYAGTPGLPALKEEGLEVMLINSNPATIMTDGVMADEIYIEPLTLTPSSESSKRKNPTAFCPPWADRPA